MGGGVYTMENKDSMTDYQEVVRVKEQKWEMVEIGTIHIHYFLYTQGIKKSSASFLIITKVAKKNSGVVVV